MSKTCPVCGTSYPDGNVFCASDGTTLRADAADTDIVGTVIADRYLVRELLGEGGMGRVYLARHVRLPQQAAIKVLHPGMVADAAAVARFNREAANAARIEHDRVARVFDFGETSDGLVYLAMEFVPGRTLRAELQDQARLPVGRMANLAFQIAEGLDAAHRIGIVHRDLKPDNIIVMTDEQGVDRCKVVDFGIAKGVDSRDTQLTQAGMLVGTPEFMSPEQVLGEPLDARSDVYALALVAFLGFAGVLPFPSGTAERSLTARLVQDPDTLAIAAPDIEWPAALQAAFDRALQREVSDRTPTALEFGDAVVAAVEGWTGVSVLRPRTPMSTPALTLAAGEVSAASLTPPPRQAMPALATRGASGGSHPTVVERRSRMRSPATLAGAAGLLVALSAGGFIVVRNGQDANAATPDATSSDVATPPRGIDSSNGAGSPPVPVPVPAAPSGASRAPQPAPVGSSDASPSVGGGAAGAPPTARTAAAGANPRLESEAARLEYQRITRLLEADDADGETARAAIPALRALLPRFDNATDSTWTYIYLATAHGMAAEQAAACVPLRNGERLATTPQQRTMLQALRDGLTCTG